MRTCLLGSRNGLVRVYRPAVGLLLILLSIGCAEEKRPRVTIMSDPDYTQIAQTMAGRFQESEFVQSRSAEDPPARIVVAQIVNLTSDIIPRSAKAMMVNHIRRGCPETILKEKHIEFIVPGASSMPSTAPAPTHRLSGTFRSATRVGPKWREELYQCEYELVDISNGQLVWADQFELPRWAEGEVTK